jgi:hypothetical protein
MRLRSVLTMLLGWWVVGALGSGCVTPMAGSIPPAAFQFHKVVSHQGRDEGGWRVAQTLITLTRISQAQPLQAQCDVEIGVPLVNGQGRVADVVVQEAAATAANEAARFALSKRPATSAELCALFRGEIGRILADTVWGVRVRRFVETGIPQTTFAPE